MNLYTHDGILLYESSNDNIRQSIEQAIKDGIILDNIDLKHQDLRNINLDNAIMRGASLYGADLTGANMSEGCFDFTDFTQALLYNTCLAYSSIIGGKFINSEFGATDFAQANIERATFAQLSTFSIDFKHTHSMKQTTYFHNHTRYKMETPPIHIKGRQHDMTILDDHVLVEQEMFSYQEFENIPYTTSKADEHTLFYKHLTEKEKIREII